MLHTQRLALRTSIADHAERYPVASLASRSSDRLLQGVFGVVGKTADERYPGVVLGRQTLPSLFDLGVDDQVFDWDGVRTG